MAAVDADVVKKIEGAHDILQKDEKGHSLLKKYLTKEVIEANKNKKTAMGASLWDCIQSGKRWLVTLISTPGNCSW